MHWTRYVSIALLAHLLIACQTLPVGPPPLPPDVSTSPFTGTTTFWIFGPQSVALSQFNVTSAGKVVIVANWTGASSQLQMELQGRRRTALPDPTEPYAVVTGASPLELTYDVQPEDLARGVSWRIVLKDPATGHDARGTLQITTPLNADRERDFRAGRLALRSGDMWPSAWLQFHFLADLNTAPAGALHAVVTLNKACNCKENQLLDRQGVRLLKHLPNRHALARIQRGFVPSPASFVAAITPLEPEDKIDPNILVGNYAKYTVAPDSGASTNMVVAGPGLLNLTVTFFDDVEAARIRQIFLAEGVTPVRLSDAQWQVTLPEARLRVLAANDEVEAIDVGRAPPMADNDNSRALIGANALQNATINAAGTVITFAGASGLGVTAGVNDTGIDATHPDLNVVATISPAAIGSHGTHVAGTIAGSGAQSNGTNAAGNPNGGTAFQWRGIAPQTGLISSSTLDTAGSMRTAIQTNSLDVTNRSQSITFDGNYDANNSRIDSLIAGTATDGDNRVPPRLLVTSAGNHGNAPNNQRPANGGTFGTTTTLAGGTGYFSITKEMKNALVVGNQSSLAGVAVVSLAASSSLGPAYDGRTRPDVLALGTSIISTGTAGDGSCVAAAANLSSGYTSCTGTSMATPAITGGVAQLLELWQNTYNAPIGAALDANPPLPALLRALLIGSATDVVQNDVRNAVSADQDLDSTQGNGNDGQGRIPATAGPDYATGWGTANIGAAATILQDARNVSGRAQANRMVQGSIFQGGVREYDFVVNQAGPVRVTLAWDDFEATTLNPATSPMLVNDLDLELVRPDGTVFFPWRLGHTINDTNGNPIADAAQVPGTAIQVQASIAPITNPSFQWQFGCPGGGMPPCATVPVAVGATNPDYVPIDAVDGNGANDVWVATTGKDHLNNVEQVLVNVPNTPTEFGHWKARVIGFNVREDTQSFALVGFPFPALAELVPSSTARVGLNAFGTPITFTWQVQNTGTVGTGVGFTHQVFLSTDFALGGDVPLTDTTAAAFAPLAAGATATRTSTITITAADAQALLGNPSATIDDLIAADVFLLVRADSGDAVLEHNDVNLLAVQVARQVDVVAVLDRSGSMAAAVPITAGTQTKLQMLQDSANLFVDLLRRDAGDRLGQVSFANNVTTDFENGSGSVKPYGVAETAAVKAAIAGLSANDATNIRGALERALSMIPASTDRRKVVLFFSDGMRTAGGNPTEASFLQRFTDENVKVFSVGFGTEGGDGLSGLDIGLLQQLATASSGGFFFVTQSGLELDKFFVNALANAVSAEVIVDPVETLAPGASTEVAIDAAGPDRIVTFVLTWDNPALDPVFELVSPEGVVFNSTNTPRFSDAIMRIDAAAHSLVQVNLPLRVGANQVHAGRWKMRVRNPTGSSIRFAATAITESEIVAATTIEPPADGIFDLGEPIQLKTAMRSGDGPITDARITIRADMPVTSLGNVLASAGITQAEINATPSVIANEPVDQLRRMTIALTRRLGHDPIGRTTATFSGNADPAVPGAYTARFPLTRVPGVFTFTTHAEALLKECDMTTRESVTSAYVPPVTDPRRTPIRVTTGSGRLTLTFTPLDSAGNYIGPGQGGRILIRADGLTPVAPTVDRLDGSYLQMFQPIAGARTATIHVQVLGVELPPQRVSLETPTVTGVTVSVGTTTGTTRTRLILGERASGAVIRGVSFSRNGVATPAPSFKVDESANAIDVVVPAGLAPGEYDVVVQGPEGPGPVSEGLVFRVVDAKKPQPYVATIEGALQAISTTGDSTGEQRQSLLAAVREVTPDSRVTAAMKQEALLETVDLLSRDGSPVSRSSLPALGRLLAATQGSAPKGKP